MCVVAFHFFPLFFFFSILVEKEMLEMCVYVCVIGVGLGGSDTRNRSDEVLSTSRITPGRNDGLVQALVTREPYL